MSDHHPFGPSILEMYDPRSRGCRVYLPGSSHYKSEAGSLKHLAFSTKDFSVLEGDTKAEQEVAEARTIIDFHSQKFDGEEFREIRLENEINFGTVDLLRFDREKTKAFVGDLKFGDWPVTSAPRNLQLLNYLVLVFDCYPSVLSVKAVIYQAPLSLFSKVVFRRISLPRLKERIATIVREAQRAAEKPEPKDFTPYPDVCGYCTRIACPARVELASTLVSAWHRKPVKFFPSLDPTVLSNQLLADLKVLGSSVRSFADAVDAEAKRRAVEERAIIPGFELVSRSGKRVISGVDKINKAQLVIQEAWNTVYPSAPLPIGEIVMKLAELGVGDLEKDAGQHAPKGEITRAQKLISQALFKANLIEQTPIIFLAPIKSP
jgi:Protein of unknown function (DUF2800)